MARLVHTHPSSSTLGPMTKEHLKKITVPIKTLGIKELNYVGEWERENLQMSKAQEEVDKELGVR